MDLTPFRMERWQSTWEHRVRFNLSESGVHPLSLRELLDLASEESPHGRLVVPSPTGGGHRRASSGRAGEAHEDEEVPAPVTDLERIRLGYGQSNGSDELRARIAALYEGADDSNVLVTVGGAEANFAAFWHLMEPGHPVAVMLPSYMQVPGLCENFRAPALPFRLREEEGWQPDLAPLEHALEEGARFVLVTNPNNPTGAVLGEEAVDGIVERAAHHGAWILADEVYQGAEVEGGETPSFWGRYDRVLVTNSLSKAYGLPGLRLGWIVGPAEEIATLWGRTDYTTIAPATLSDALATVALGPGVRARILERTRAILRENLAVLTGWTGEQGTRFRYRPPDAGAICYLRYDADVGSSELAEYLRTEKDVLVVPGDHFGMDRYLRIGFGNPTAELTEALGRIAEAFEERGARVG